ncbi:AlpA family phage regulatory protein [Acinetobacter radioresistens]|uniref:helix-turn-helix transcriptional regulator n=1 Tax=Acinetobacter radioresistens TaxID=40216 RepID=UPI0021CD66B0|nr:AlpA family phage regulatory protein [Acinetobacter radioresistens]MCU4499256.1 AlpA family phage regulatory protein [Acinetobacter radioresistens]
MYIDRRVRAKEFMNLLAVGRTKFYELLKSGKLPQPVRLSEKDIFWYESIVKKEVEKFKDNTE